MLKIGLTGGIGSGKSTVAKVFKLLNIPVYDADTVSKRLYDTNKELMASMKAYFGEDIYTNDRLNRQKLAAIVFNDAPKLQYLNSLVHPLIIQDAQQWMVQQTTPYVIKEAALLFESGAAEGLDYVIGVQTPKHLRIKRVMDRDHVTQKEVIARMNKQIDEEIKMRLCDFVIKNNEQELVLPQVLQLHEKFLVLAEKSL